MKLMHTVVWAFFVGCILGIPLFAWRDDFRSAMSLIAIVLIEVAILLLNHFECPPHYYRTTIHNRPARQL